MGPSILQMQVTVAAPLPKEYWVAYAVRTVTDTLSLHTASSTFVESLGKGKIQSEHMTRLQVVLHRKDLQMVGPQCPTFHMQIVNRKQQRPCTTL